MLLAAIAGLAITTLLLLLLRAAEMGPEDALRGDSARGPGCSRPVITDRRGRCAPRRGGVLWLWVLWGGTGKGPAAVMLIAMLAIGWTTRLRACLGLGRLQLGPAHRRPARRVHRWVGGLLALATSARPLFLTGHDRAYALETAERLSRLAGLALLSDLLISLIMR